MDILNLTPHKVSRTLEGYTVMFYGDIKSGKTTISTMFPKHLLLGFEKGWNAIPGAMAVPINSWVDALKVFRQLRSEDAKERYRTIIIDTADIAFEYVKSYVAAQEGVNDIGDIPYGKGHSQVAAEFDSKLRALVQMGYGVVLISHAVDKTITTETGAEFNRIMPTLPAKASTIVSRMCDIVGYSSVIIKQDGTYETRLFMRGTPRYVAGSRFKYTPDSIVFTYQNLVDAIGEAIDKEAAEHDGKFVSDEPHQNLYGTPQEGLDFKALMADFYSLTGAMFEATPEDEHEALEAQIVRIVEKHLGQGRKIAKANPTQVELIDIIVTELRDLSLTLPSK